MDDLIEKIKMIIRDVSTTPQGRLIKIWDLIENKENERRSNEIGKR